MLDSAVAEKVVRFIPHLLQRTVQTQRATHVSSRGIIVSALKSVVIPAALLATVLAVLRAMSFRQEILSWLHLPQLELSSVPQPGNKAPSTSQLVLPCNDGRPAIVVFLRHCGCPCKKAFEPLFHAIALTGAIRVVAEKTFRLMRSTADSHSNTHFIAVSHSDREATDKWLKAVGGAGNIGIIVDANRTLYAQWGLGVSNWWHVLSPWTFYNLWSLWKNEGVKNRPTESGSRWQTSGSFAVNGEGLVTWGGAAAGADTIPNFEAAIQSMH